MNLDLAQIIQSKQRFQMVLDGIPEGIILVDQNLRILLANKEMGILTGISVKDLKGSFCYKVIFKRKTPCPRCPTKNTFKTKKEALTFFQKTSEEGKLIELQISSFPIYDKERGVILIIERIKDATEKKRLQQFVEKLESYIALEQLVAGLAHDMGNTLAMIRSTSQFLLSKFEKNLPYKEYIEVIEKNASVASGLVAELLQWAQPKKPKPKLLDVNQVLDKACFLLKSELKKNKVIVIKNYYSSTLPKSLGNPEQLQRLFVNILLNSIQAMTHGGEIILKTSLHPPQKSIKIEISDNGKGISRENLTKVFDPFFTTKEKGTGLGLSIAYSVVQAHGGTISIQSQEKDGTKLTITLPSL